MNIENLIKTIHCIKSILEMHKENNQVSRIMTSFEQLSDCILEDCKKGNYKLEQGKYLSKDGAEIDWVCWITTDYWQFRRIHYGTYRFCGSPAGYAFENFYYYQDENKIKCNYLEMDSDNPYNRDYCISMTPTDCFYCEP